MKRELIIQKVNSALDELYKNDEFLFEYDLCERCIQHKFANHLEQQGFGDGFFIDCEYNRAYSGDINTKKVTSEKGNSIDIVITKRNNDYNDDLVCFELKKWNNKEGEKGFKSDRLRLEILTGKRLPTNTETGENLKDKDGNYYRFNYKYGFFVIFGKTRDKVEMKIFNNQR